MRYPLVGAHGERFTGVTIIFVGPPSYSLLEIPFWKALAKGNPPKTPVNAESSAVSLPIGVRNAKLAAGDRQPADKISFDFYLNLWAAADD